MLHPQQIDELLEWLRVARRREAMLLAEVRHERDYPRRNWQPGERDDLVSRCCTAIAIRQTIENALDYDRHSTLEEIKNRAAVLAADLGSRREIQELIGPAPRRRWAPPMFTRAESPFTRGPYR